MEEEMMNQEGMMAQPPQPAPEPTQPPQDRLVKVLGDRVENNLQNLNEQEMQLITQLNVPQFREFMSKVFGPEFSIIMKTRVPEPQAQPQPVSQPSESPAPMTGQGMMTQPPVR